MQQQASVIWKGSGKSGNGEISSGSGALKNIFYSQATRSDGKRGTNPEELIAAAHASCFTMALSGALTKVGYEVNKLETEVVISAEKINNELRVISSHLKVEGDIPGIGEAQFRNFVDEVKVSCPISRVLNLEISAEARLKNNKQEIFLEQMI